MFFLLLFACITDDWKPDAPRPVEPGAPRVGAAEGFLQLPVGTPLSGYSVRCSCLTGQSRQDDRRSAYTVGFVESTGVQTFPTIKVIWLENGDDHLVLTKTDSISFSGDISFNINVATVLSQEFQAFDDNIAAGRRGAMIIELQKCCVYCQK